MSWRPVAGITILRKQVNKRFPKRDKASDGIIGDADHMSRDSDHNEDPVTGYVHALDIDEDFGAPGDNRILADQLVEYCRQKRVGSERVKYVVYEDQVASGTYPDTFWRFRGSGFSHYQHIHVSFTKVGEADAAPFDLPILQRDSIWDGYIPSRNGLYRAYADQELKNLASYRLACRLKDLGYYTGDVEPVYVQGYPVKAIIKFKGANGFASHTRITELAQLAIFGGFNE